MLHMPSLGISSSCRGCHALSFEAVLPLHLQGEINGVYVDLANLLPNVDSFGLNREINLIQKPFTPTQEL